MAVGAVISSRTLGLSVVLTAAHERTGRARQKKMNRETTHRGLIGRTCYIGSLYRG